MGVLGWMCCPGRYPGNSHSLPELLPVRMLGREARCSVSSEAKGSGTVNSRGSLRELGDAAHGLT